MRSDSSSSNSTCVSNIWRPGLEPNTPLENTIISISTTFYPGATIDSLPTDLILLSVEPVAFFVHSARLLSVSENGFNQLVSGAASNRQEDDPDPIIPVPESSAVLNIILQSIYGMSATHFAHSFDDLSLAVASFPKYGLSVSAYLAPSAPLAATLLSHVSTSPLEVYCLAASHDLWHIASSASRHLLSFALPNLTDEQATRMGPIYLKRLFFLHLGRTDALKRLLLPPPCAHAPTTECDYTEQKRVTRAWALASAYLLLDAKPDMGVKTMEAALSPLAEYVDCEMCKAALMERVKEAVVQWSGVKVCGGSPRFD